MGWIFSERCKSKARLDNKTAIVTGANAGIGFGTALDFYKRGAKVILACRNMQRANDAVEEIKKECKDLQDVGQLKVVKLDLASLQSVRDCAKQIMEEEERIDILVNNGGVITKTRELSEDGYEMQFATNHLGHFLLTLLLLPRILKSAPARIVNVSSLMHKHIAGIDFEDINLEKSYKFHKGYAHSKLANVLFTKELAKKLSDTKVNVYSLNPGAIQTKMGADFVGATGIPGAAAVYKFFGCFMRSGKEGAATVVYCAVDESTSEQTGFYYDDCALATPSAAALDVEMATKLWDVSKDMVHLGDYDPFKEG